MYIRKLAAIAAILTTMAISHSAMADAKLSLHINGTSPDNKWFLCTQSDGCVSMMAANKGKVYPLTPGKITQAFVMNLDTHRLYKVTLPQSCIVNVPESQTLEMKGKIRVAGDDAKIDGIHCHLVG